MTALLSELLKADDHKLATAKNGGDAEPATPHHNRSSHMAGRLGTVMAGGDDDSMPEADISAWQKMLSATSGSLLTSLLGTS